MTDIMESMGEGDSTREVGEEEDSADGNSGALQKKGSWKLDYINREDEEEVVVNGPEEASGFQVRARFPGGFEYKAAKREVEALKMLGLMLKMMMKSNGTSAMLRAGICRTAYSTIACFGVPLK